MFNLSKSPEDLQDKKDIQHKVLCDWLRNIQQQNIQLARRLTVLQKTIDLLLNENNPRLEEFNDDSSESRSVS